ncbi:ribose transport system substrate-binding protein [Escherichia coli]|nr:ribose transport system substrate-binding protein [Escherichia coli]
MKLRLTLLTAATLTALSFSAHAVEKGTIMIMVNSLDNPYYASEAKGASEKAQQLGYKTTILSHGEDVKKQNELIDTAIGKKVQGIILDNADSTASVAAIEKAKKAGIPVILINREIPVDDVALVQITHNNFQAGSEVANAFVEKMGEKGKYAELTCNLADNNCVTRSKSFHQVIDIIPPGIKLPGLYRGKNMQRNFQGKTVVITGACRGIGAGIAERFARDGANLVMVSNAERVHETAEQLRQCYQADILSLEVDVTDEAQVQALYEQAAARFGSIDVSIQNAGIITIDYFDRMPAADFEKVLAVNTTAVWLCCREAAKYMVKQNHGCLINTSSGQGRQGFIYTPHYAASKMGVIGITQSLAHELAQWNITVNAFCPGIIESEMWDYNDRVWGEILSTDDKRYGKGELMAEWVEGIPMKRAGKPEDVAGLVAFLASDDARYLTGQTINIDGGLIMS